MFLKKAIIRVVNQSSSGGVTVKSTSAQANIRAVPLVLVLLVGCSRLVTCRPQQEPTSPSAFNSSLAAVEAITQTTISSIVSTSSPPTPPTPSTSTRPESISAITNATTSNAQTPLNQTDGEPPAASTPKPVTPISSSSASNSSADLLAAPTKFDQVKNSSSSRSSLPSESEPKLVGAASEGIPETAAAVGATTPSNSTNANAGAVADDDKWEFDERGFRKCNAANSSALNRCLRLIVQDLRPRLRNGFGIPELNIPPLDPLRLRSVSFEHGSGPIKVIATFKNVVAMGLGHLNKTDFEVDMKRRVLDYDLEIPQMQIIGEYELSGNLFFFPVGGKGNFAVNLQRITAKGQGKLGIVILNNRKTVQMNKIDIDLDIANVKVHLTNLFNGDPVWGNVINKFLNDNSKDIFEEIRPKIAMQVSELVKSVSNRALTMLGADHFADVQNTKVDLL